MKTSNLQPLYVAKLQKVSHSFVCQRLYLLTKMLWFRQLKQWPEGSAHCLLVWPMKGTMSSAVVLLTKINTLKQDLRLRGVRKQLADNSQSLIHRCSNLQSIKNSIQCFKLNSGNLFSGKRTGINTYSLAKDGNRLTQALGLLPLQQGWLHLAGIL